MQSDSYSVLRAWFVIFITSLFFFYEFGLYNIFDALEHPIRLYYHMNSTEVGVISSLYYYGNLLFLIPAGMLLDRYSPRWLIVIAMLACSTGVLLVAMSSSVVVLAISRFVMGLGGGFCLIGCIRIAVNWFHFDKMARVTGFIVTIGMIGGFAVHTPFMILINHTSWRYALGVYAVLGYIIMLLIFWVVRDTPPAFARRMQERHQLLSSIGIWKSLGLAMRNKQNWFCAIYGGMINLPIALLGALWGIPYLMARHHFTSTDAATISGMLFIGTVFGSPAMGWISDRLRRRKLPMIVGILLAIVNVYAIIYFPSNSFWGLFFLFLLLGFITSTQIISYPTLAESNSRMISSTATSIISMFMVGGGAVAQPIFGKLLQIHWNGAMSHGIPVYSAADFQIAMSILPVAFVISLIAGLLVKETHCKHLHETD